MQQGMITSTKEELYLKPQCPGHSYGPELHSNVAVLKVINWCT